jgi:hypothetical protein
MYTFSPVLASLSCPAEDTFSAMIVMSHPEVQPSAKV